MRVFIFMVSAKSIYTIIVALLAVFFSASCIQKDDRMKAAESFKDSIYPEKAITVQINVTDSGHMIAQINSPLMERFNGKHPYLEMKQGLTAYFYDKLGVKQNQLDANYGISYEDKKIIEVRNDVRLENVKGERLNTEKLTWNQLTKKIYTDQFVKITTPDQVIYGEGFESNQNFTEYRIFKIKGTLSLKDAAKDTTNANTAPGN